MKKGEKRRNGIRENRREIEERGRVRRRMMMIDEDEEEEEDSHSLSYGAWYLAVYYIEGVCVAE